MSIVFPLSPFLFLLVIKPCRSLWRGDIIIIENMNCCRILVARRSFDVYWKGEQDKKSTKTKPISSQETEKETGRCDITWLNNKRGNKFSFQICGWNYFHVSSSWVILDQRVYYLNIYTQETRATVKILLPKHASKWIPSFLILYYFLPSSWFLVTA